MLNKQQLINLGQLAEECPVIDASASFEHRKLRLSGKCMRNLKRQKRLAAIVQDCPIINICESLKEGALCFRESEMRLLIRLAIAAELLEDQWVDTHDLYDRVLPHPLLEKIGASSFIQVALFLEELTTLIKREDIIMSVSKRLALVTTWETMGVIKRHLYNPILAFRQTIGFLADTFIGSVKMGPGKTIEEDIKCLSSDGSGGSSKDAPQRQCG